MKFISSAEMTNETEGNLSNDVVSELLVNDRAHKTRWDNEGKFLW